MDLGIFQRAVEIETGRDGSSRASIQGVKAVEGRNTTTIFGIGADPDQARAALALEIVNKAREGAAQFMAKFGERKPIIASGNNVSIG